MFSAFKQRSVSLVLLFLSLGACSNAFRDFPDKTTDEYMIDKARRALDLYKFNEALDQILPVLEDSPDNFEAREIAMKAYAGRAGLRTLDFLLALTDLGSNTFFQVFVDHYPNASLQDVEDIESAVTLLEEYETDASLRSGEINLLAMLLYYSRIGVNLHYYAYDSDNNLVAGFDACEASDIPDAAVQKIARSLSYSLDASNYISDNSAISSAFGTLTSTLTSNPLLSPILNAENAICPADSLPCEAMRMLVNEGDLGIGIGSGALTPCL